MVGHPLEREFGLDCHLILDIIAARRRCKTAVGGAVAEYYVGQYLDKLAAGGLIASYAERDKDGEPDFLVKTARGEIDIECKRSRNGRIDFMRTRSPKGWPEGRYYHPDEFSVLAACSIEEGSPFFAFVLTAELPRHPLFAQRLDNDVVVPDPPTPPWTANLLDALHRASPRDERKLASLRNIKQQKRASAKTPKRPGKT